MPMPWQNVRLPDLSGVQVDKPKFLRPGLLDQIFGMGGQDAGLFGQDVTKRAGQMGLLNAGLTMLAAGGRQPNRTMYGPRPNLGQALLQSLQAGQQGYQQVLGGASDLGAMRDKQKEAAMAAAKQAQIERLQQEFFSGPQTPERITEYTAKLAAIKGDAGAMSQSAIAAANLRPDPAKPPTVVSVQESIGPNGKPMYAMMMSDGTTKMSDAPVYNQPRAGGGGNGNERLDRATLQGIVNDYQQDTRESRMAAEGMAQIRAAADNPGESSYNALLYGFAKLLDPGSVVREGEYATLTKIGSLPTRAGQLVKMAMSGKMSDKVKQEIISQSKMLTQQRINQFDSYRSDYTGRAGAYGLDPNLVNNALVDYFKPVRGYVGGQGGAGATGDADALIAKYGRKPTGAGGEF